jgi:hypothetical protein
MEKYHDLPMDYADATLVAWRRKARPITSSHEIARDSPYRLRGKKAFRLVP